MDPHSRTYLFSEELPDYDYTKGSIVIIPDVSDIDPVMLIKHENRKLDYAPSSINIIEQKQDGENTVLTLTSSGYIHGVYVKGNFKCSDNYFDLLPGQKKTITVLNPSEEILTLNQVR